MNKLLLHPTPGMFSTELTLRLESSWAPIPTTEVWYSRVRFNDLDINTREKYEHLFDEFEHALSSRADSSIESWLPKFDIEHESVVCVELISLEVGFRVSKSEAPTREEYCNRFPKLESEVLDLFNARELTRTFKPFEQLTVDTPSKDSRAVFGDFELIRRLGQGAFGEVFLAREKTLDRLVALKMPINQSGWSDKQREQFVTEARLAAKLDHPGIVKVYSVGTVNDLTCIVLEYIKGRSLENVLREGNLNWKDKVKIVTEVADAMHYAHSQQVYHRDLKPSNILLDMENRPRVVDFGLAIGDSEQFLRENEVAGTLNYMSPEQTRGAVDQTGGHTDVWGLGVILYRALTSELPFAGETSGELVSQIRNHSPRPPPRSFKEDPQVCEFSLS